MRRSGPQLDRHKAFIFKVLADFSFQWRHLLGGSYNNSTFQKLASAIIRIITLDFNVIEVTTSRQGMSGFLVWLDNLPEWNAFSGHIRRVGGVSIVISQHPQHATALIRDDYQNYIVSQARYCSSTASEEHRTYLILTVREVMLYRINTESERCTEPRRLFDGSNPPSDAAMELLVKATHTKTSPTTLHQLPVELQGMILSHVSEGPIERARLGCLLNIGSSFTWQFGGRTIEREEGCRGRTPWTPVESQICFGKWFSGIAYK